MGDYFAANEEPCKREQELLQELWRAGGRSIAMLWLIF
ncbi:DUF3243 family protein [Paenibacillus bouchesdurhonensis]